MFSVCGVSMHQCDAQTSNTDILQGAQKGLDSVGKKFVVFYLVQEKQNSKQQTDHD